MDLLVCTRPPDLSKLDKQLIKECHIICLRERAVFGHRKGPQKKAQAYTEYITELDYDNAREAIQELWRDIVANETRTDLDHYEYNFCSYYTPVHFWELALRRAILTKRPKRIWISESISRSGRLTLTEDHIAGIADLNEWMLNRCILKVINEFMPEVRTLPDLQNKNEKRKKGTSNYLRLPSLLAIERLLRIGLAFRLKTIFSASKSRNVVIIAQKTKTLRLECALKSQGVNYILYSYASAERCIAKPPHNIDFCFALDYDSTTSPLDALVQWITAVSLYHDKVLDQNIDTFLDSNKAKVVITDGDSNPLVRRLNKYIKGREGYSIVTIPEGGFDMDRQAPNETYRLKPHRNHIKCVLSEESLHRLEPEKSKFKDIIVIGYDTSLVLARLIALPIRFAVKLLTNNKFKGIIFYDYPFFTSQELGILRTSATPEIEELYITDQISRILADTDYLVVSHLRCIDVYTKYFPKRFIHVGFHWSLLAHTADVVVSTSSSIVSECLSIKTPVLLWQPKSKGVKAFEYLTSKIPPLKTIKTVSRSSEVEPALNELLKVTEEDFKESDRYAPIPNHPIVAKRIRLLLSEKTSGKGRKMFN